MKAYLDLTKYPIGQKFDSVCFLYSTQPNLQLHKKIIHLIQVY